MRMMTLRSNDQFNATLYGFDDCVRGARDVVLMKLSDMERLRLHESQEVVREKTECLMAPA